MDGRDTISVTDPFFSFSMGDLVNPSLLYILSS